MPRYFQITSAKRVNDWVNQLSRLCSVWLMRRLILGLAFGGALLSPSAALADGLTPTVAPIPAATTNVAPTTVPTQWTAYGFNITAPASIWPSLELLHLLHFDWELASASQRPTPIVLTDLPAGAFGEYDRTANVVQLSNMLLGTSLEARTAFLAHELTHLNDDLNGRLGDPGDLSANGCYATEVRAFQNEANFWQMVFGPQGKPGPDPIEARENIKMWAFVGNAYFTDLVVRTTPSYIRQCGREN
jgi:hypothetical protein